MLKKLFNLHFLALLFGANVRMFAQVCTSQTGAPIQMQVQLAFADAVGTSSGVPGTVTTQTDSAQRGDSAGVQAGQNFSTSMQIHVQLQEPTGGTLQESVPTSDGQVRLTVCKNGIYRLRVLGPTIEETTLDGVQPGRGDRLVTIVIHRKETGKELKSQKASVSARQLQIPRKARKQFERGDKSLKMGDLEMAGRYYSKAIEICPNFDEAENNLGIVRMQQGRKAEGRAEFERAIAINPRYAPGYLNLAKIAFDEKRFADAYALVRQALAAEPLNPGALFVAAESAFFTGEYSNAVAYTRTLHSLPHKQYALAHFLSAKSLQLENRPNEAIVECQTFLEEDPQDANAERAHELLALLQASISNQSQNGQKQ